MGHHTNSRAFTIVELLIVIVVIAILATIVVVAYRGITDQAARSSLQAELRSVSTIVEMDNQRDGAYPATLAAANEGKGITLTSGAQLYYGPESYGYCAHVAKSGEVYRIKSDSGQIESGVGCKPLTTYTAAAAYFARSNVATQSRTFTLSNAYTSQRWLVGAILRRNQTTAPTVTVDATPITSPLHMSAGSYGYTWFVAQPTGTSTTVQFTGGTTGYEYGFAIWEVFSPVKPVIESNATTVVNSPATVNGYPGGATLGVAMQTSATPPGGTVTTSNTGASAGWYMFVGGMYPAKPIQYTLNVSSESGSVVVVRGG